MDNKQSPLTISFALFGSILAAVISWTTNHSVLWAIFHGLVCGWIYVLYYAFGFGRAVGLFFSFLY